MNKVSLKVKIKAVYRLSYNVTLFLMKRDPENWICMCTKKNIYIYIE